MCAVPLAVAALTSRVPSVQRLVLRPAPSSPFCCDDRHESQQLIQRPAVVCSHGDNLSAQVCAFCNAHPCHPPEPHQSKA
ncbi:hypothetical protein FA95DRAFT_71877 [Auriscalpium vulgare]|uniref:Uncharacterized protein n=1 Tax=Auriscalpium vulgare TaxID=40419 RepID=A0ACB8RR40_9AGAM|nr:hypothetical protein FA95DRAFT_71877 [Auriscalpium vulgare]